MSDLNFQLYVREPFAVEAVQITEENMEEIAKLIGLGIRVKNDVKYIALDRRVVPNISRAYIGWWVTSLSDNLRCYSPKVFAEQFMAIPESNEISWSFNGELEDTSADFEPEESVEV